MIWDRDWTVHGPENSVRRYHRLRAGLMVLILWRQVHGGPWWWSVGWGSSLDVGFSDLKSFECPPDLTLDQAKLHALWGLRIMCLEILQNTEHLVPGALIPAVSGTREHQ